MKVLVKLIFLAILAISLQSCKKDTKDISQEEDSSHLPNYSNVNLDEAFDKSDSELANKEAIRRELSRYYDAVWEANNLWGGILVAKGDDILFEKYRGYGKSNNQNPIRANSPMHVASVSKTITAVAILKLIEAGKLNLDDALTKFFPQFPYPKVTIFTLLSQRSGLPKYEHFIKKIKPEPTELSKKFLSNQDILNILIKYKPELARDTDTGFMYCNTNFALLALVIEKVTKMPFPELIQQMIFKPLEMKNSYIFQEKDIATANKSFYAEGKEYPLDRLDLIYGDKNVYTTPRDLFNFSKALFSKDFLKPELKDKIFQPYSNEKEGVNNYGLGFRMKIFDNGEKLTYHNGWWHGSNAVFVHLLKSKVTIVAIGNKYSRKLYSAMLLAYLFEDFPVLKEKLVKEMGDQSNFVDSANADNYTE